MENLLKFGTLENGVLRVENSFKFDKYNSESLSCTLVSTLASWKGDTPPKIQFELYADGQSDPFYLSHTYTIGRKGEDSLKQWRVPPMFLPKMKLSVIVTVPETTTLYIKNFAFSPDNTVCRWRGGVRFNAHLGFWGLAPDNTMAAYELAALSGFPACIVNPRVTKDGVFVCLHDDGIDRVAREKNGKCLTPPNYFADFTYDELSKYEYGSWKNEIYKGQKMPLLEDFFALCSKTGMMPMFSTHPALTIDEWKKTRRMLEKYGLLKLFHIKSFEIDILKDAYSVFGEEIDGYTHDIGWWTEDSVKKILSIGIDTSKCRVGAEVMFNQYTEEIVDEIISAGLFAAAWDVKRRDFDEFERLISWGVSEFTEDYHCSMGLNC